MRITMLPLAALLMSAAVTADEYELVTESKPVPLPAAASEELRESIANWPLPNVAASRNAPTSDDEWQAQIESIDGNRAEAIRQLITERPVTVDELDLDGVAAHRVLPESIAPHHADRLFVYLHGGAYVYGNGFAGLSEAILIAERLQIEVISIDYRMPPAHPFPAAVDDAVSAWSALVESRNVEGMALGGTSAGGGLTLATVLKLKALGLPLPGALYLGTPWSDLSKTGDSLITNEGLDRVLVTYDGGLGAAAKLYADGRDLKQPLLSPLYGDFDGFPPTILATGTRDMFLSDVARTHRKLRAAGVTADLHVYEGMSHAGYLLAPNTPESVDLYREVGVFIDTHLDQ